MIKFKYTILYVADVEKSVTFYENAFACTRTFVTPDNDYGELLTGETTLSFASKTLAASNLKDGFQAASLAEKPFGIEIGFITDDVEKLVADAIKHGATLYQAPLVKPWGQTVAYVRDLDGFLVEICTEMK
ncbi:putative glyoxalase superfamily protein PhnB [Chitinophaga skermanii]|uniref:Putative glyoxalase superfamily protein PhnB n=1 Tax=Chitinophaga skermanii TaxID=331697 RepID=A0A327QMM2_9BACT|nr:VOC family protein [Chitinophaga skermanii]RAJ05288.1 putative glyoxalase superfamily protein PhnB [Chitinophaga skermanii]